MNHEMVSRLCDPNTREPLELIAGNSHNGSDILRNPKTGATYPIKQDIPVFVEKAEVKGSNKKFQIFYDWYARIYDPMNTGFFKVTRMGDQDQLRMEYLSQLDIKDGDNVLEVSVGTGANMHCLPDTARYYGLDLSWGMLRQCVRRRRREGFQCELIMGAAENLPFPDNSFDSVFHVGGIKFFSDKAKAIEEMVRVAKPGSKILIVDQSEKLAKQVFRIPVVNKLFAGVIENAKPPTGLIPEGMVNIQLGTAMKDNVYVLQFEKPALD